MEIIQWLYFITVGFYIFQITFAKKSKLSWLLVLIAVALHAFYFFEWQGMLFLLVAGIIATISELISLKTPINIFGVSYQYNLKSVYFPTKITVAGVYPVEVTAAWILLKYLSFFMVSSVLSPLGIHGLSKAIVSAIALVSFDFLIDPIAVENGAWKWKKSGWFFGIPWQNFVGWFFVGLIVSVLFMNLEPRKNADLLMTIPVLIVWAVFPLMMGKALIKRDKIKGILANIPIIFFLVLGILSLF